MIQARRSPRLPWVDMGENIGFIAAAKLHAARTGLIDGTVEVRDTSDERIPPAAFHIRQMISYEVLNPRQDAE